MVHPGIPTMVGSTPYGTPWVYPPLSETPVNPLGWEHLGEETSLTLTKVADKTRLAVINNINDRMAGREDTMRNRTLTIGVIRGFPLGLSNLSTFIPGRSGAVCASGLSVLKGGWRPLCASGLLSSLLISDQSPEPRRTLRTSSQRTEVVPGHGGVQGWVYPGWYRVVCTPREAYSPVYHPMYTREAYSPVYTPYVHQGGI